jgi:hypothetical protein
MRRMAVPLALLLVAGCGPAERPYTPRAVEQPAATDGAAEPPATTEGAEETPAATGGPEATAAAEDPASKPLNVKVGDLEIRVEKPTTDKPLQRLFADYYVERWQAVMDGGDKYLDRVESFSVLKMAEWVQDLTDRKESARGVARLYRLRIRAVMGKGAQVDTCVDERGVRLVSTSTGKAVVPQPDWMRAPYLQSAIAHRDDDGVWRIRELRLEKEGCS